MDRRIAPSAALALLLATATIHVASQDAPQATRILAQTKNRELSVEVPMGAVWCQRDLTFAIHAQSDSPFKEGEVNEQGRRERFLLNKLLAALRARLGQDCPAARSVKFNGLVDGVFVYRGQAEKEGAQGDWVLVELPVNLVDTPPDPPAPQVSPASVAEAKPPRKESVMECDTLAAHPDDPKKPKGIAGVADDDIQPGAALTACEEAIKVEPNNPRLKYQLARAYLSYEQPVEAVEQMMEAAEDGHAAAIAALGDFTLFGVLDDEPDPETAKALYQRAGKAGFKPALALAAAIEENPTEDTAALEVMEPEYNYPQWMSLLVQGKELMNNTNTSFVALTTYAMNTIAGIKYQCPEAGIENMNAGRIVVGVSRKTNAVIGFLGMSNVGHGALAVLEQQAMDDGYALAVAKGCGSPEVAAVHTTFRLTYPEVKPSDLGLPAGFRP